MPDTWRLGTDEARARVAFVGCGGAGCNTLRLVSCPPNAERIALNDAPHASTAGIPRRILVRSENLRAYASMDEKVVAKMETDEEKAIVAALLDRDFVLGLGGLGGQLGGWALSLVGRVARILGDATLTLATLPFAAEGSVRRQLAEAQLDLLRRKSDGVVAFANDRLLSVARDLPLTRALTVLGNVMARPAGSLAAVLSRSDVVPLKRLLARSPDWRFGMGAGSGKHRAYLAMEEAYASPWFTGRAEDVRVAIVLVRQPSGASHEDEMLREVRLRSPRADVAWAVLPDPAPEDRVEALVLAGLEDGGTVA